MKVRALVLLAAGLAIGPVGCTFFSGAEEIEAQLAAAAEQQQANVDPNQTAPAAEATGTPQQSASALPPAASPPAASPPAAKALSRAEVASLLTGNSMYAADGNFQFAALHQQDGALKGKSWNGEATETGTGSWKVEPDGAYCRKWENAWAGGEWGCFKLFRRGDTLSLERVSGAGANGQMTLVQGNAYGL